MSYIERYYVVNQKEIRLAELEKEYDEHKWDIQRKDNSQTTESKPTLRGYARRNKDKVPKPRTRR